MVDKTVFVLGAGASFASDYQLPTMSAFFDDKDLPPKIATFLDWYYATLVPANLEEVLTYLANSEKRAPIWFGAPVGVNGECTYRDVLLYVQNRLRVNPDAPCLRHMAMFKTMRSNDSVVTLNYDVIADSALHHVETKPGVLENVLRRTRVQKLRRMLGDPRVPMEERSMFSKGRHEQPEGFYLKLHGSTNWLGCRDKTCGGPIRFPSNLVSHEFVTVATEQCELCGAALEPVIVPPVASKAAALGGRTRKIWTRAFWELAAATEVVVWGVSFAPSDTDLAWMLRAGTRARNHDEFVVHAINPDEKARKRTFSLLAPSTNHEWNDVDEYLEHREARADKGDA